MYLCPYLNNHLCPYLRAANQTYNIKINTTNLTLTLYKNGQFYKTYPIAVGKPSTPTPKGHWFITKKGLWGEQFGGHFMQLSVPTGIYGIHGTDKPWSIGKAVSNGCVRMHSNDAKEVYDLVHIGTPVTIY